MSQHARQDEGVKKNPDDWVTKDEPMTAAQESYLRTLATDSDIEPPAPNLTKAEASKLIDKLKEESPRINQDE